MFSYVIYAKQPFSDILDFGHFHDYFARLLLLLLFYAPSLLYSHGDLFIQGKGIPGAPSVLHIVNLLAASQLCFHTDMHPHHNHIYMYVARAKPPSVAWPPSLLLMQSAFERTLMPHNLSLDHVYSDGKFKPLLSFCCFGRFSVP